MKKTEVQKLGHGLYKIYWKTGGQSNAAVGSMPNGDRWIAPTNWIGGMGTTARSVWKGVKSVERIDA